MYKKRAADLRNHLHNQHPNLGFQEAWKPLWTLSPRAACHLRRDAFEPGRREIEPVYEGVDEPNRIVGDDIIVDRLWQQQKLRTFESENVSHVRY